jgi:tRNA threonylcarbamoyladenosine biosynthesis protein TsaB
MLLLALDTSGKNGSLALTSVGQGQSEISVLEVVPLSGGAFSSELVPRIAALLKKHKRSKEDLGAFAVASGPGSFTGLRVGLAAVKALAEVLQKPIAAVSLLEAVASGSATRGQVLAALDAGRSDVYVGDYELGPHVHMQRERLLSREMFLSEAKHAAASHRAVVTPDAALAEAVRLSGGVAGTYVELIQYPNSATIARLGWQHLQRGQTVRPEDLEANYIRHSDAEIFSKPAL